MEQDINVEMTVKNVEMLNRVHVTCAADIWNLNDIRDLLCSIRIIGFSICVLDIRKIRIRSDYYFLRNKKK